MGDKMNRRDFLKAAGMSTVAFTLGTTGLFSFGDATRGIASANEAIHPTSGFGGYGPLIKDPEGILDLPQGFHYRIISRTGDKMSNGDRVPAAHDGMAAFPGPKNTTILVRNHELGTNSPYPVNGKNPWSRGAAGGTTALVVTPDRKVIREYVTNSGNIRNCAGGPSTWGTWLTCEETRNLGHGFVFEVNPRDPENEMSRTPIRDMGYFSHEACAVDPATGIWYLTEDNSPSFLYRFTPHDRSQKLGSLQKGGILEAAAIDELPASSASNFTNGKKFGIIWKRVNPERAKEDARDLGCIAFSRLEGAWFAAGTFWFDDTNAGEGRHGRIYRYFPSTNTLELFYESSDANDLDMPDNITITPWGDLWIAEDGPGNDRIIGLTPEGKVYPFAENQLNDSEFAGPAFSPDGNTLFVNIQDPGMTFAIGGPFARRNAFRQSQMSVAAPPQPFAPRISDELAVFAERQGISQLEAAALHRHGVPIL
ncbi:alkaline phosphatase PhoX [Desmospora profundinema]|uniref:Secreted PhoX family phosphatase n=1 Tax=Desmospora profundinema TaxID=1571184 RepID=A0ABU1IKD2_9BACL|nr:alkaline phosphatase PhoX [Desmospora profundinema]MDR6225242.1 secreted PhoX family phosphatase [Desmospora profundinema]